MRSILVIRLSSMGDVVLTTPLIRQLQRTYPKARIDVLVDTRFESVWKFNPRIHTVWTIDVRSATDVHIDDVKLRMRESIGEHHYDLIIDLQKNVRSRLVRKGLGRQVSTIDKHRLEKLALVWLKKRPARVVPIVERYRRVVEYLPLVLDTDGPEVWLDGEASSGSYPPFDRPRKSALPRIAIAPGAAHATKRWPADHIGILCSRLGAEGYQPVLIGGPGDVALCDEIASLADVDVVRADNSTSVQQTASVLDTCSALITMDSGVMHLASARRIPTVAIFGSTVTDLGFAPYGVPYVIVEKDLACRPCSHIGRSKCPLTHFQCMLMIEPEEVLHAMKNLLHKLEITSV